MRILPNTLCLGICTQSKPRLGIAAQGAQQVGGQSCWASSGEGKTPSETQQSRARGEKINKGVEDSVQAWTVDKVL